MNEAAAPSAPAFKVLILEPDEKLGGEIVSALAEALPGANNAIARSVGEAQRMVAGQKPELFVLDVDSTHDFAQEFIYDLRTSHPDARAVILTAKDFSAQRAKVAGLGAIHFLEKPFPRSDFITLVETLLAPAGSGKGERFQGKLSDLHIADIIQLKCISGATSVLEFTGPRGEKARVFFEKGQIRHATAPGKEGRAAFDEIVKWKGGHISEVPTPEAMPRTITLDWQVLLMEAVRKSDETRPDTSAASAVEKPPGKNSSKKILVIDDSIMLLSFVKEILLENHFQVTTAPTAEEGLRACHSGSPDLVLLDYVLPDMKGDEVCRKLVADPITSKIPVVYMSGFGTDLQPQPNELPNVIGALNKPFTSDLLVSAVEKFLRAGKPAQQPVVPLKVEPLAKPIAPPSLGAKVAPETKPAPQPAPKAEPAPKPEPIKSAPQPTGKIVGVPPINVTKAEMERSPKPNDPPTPPPKAVVPPRPTPMEMPRPATSTAPKISPAASEKEAPPTNPSGAYFCGDSSFFSLYWALQTIAREKLTGTLRALWTQDSVELLARSGQVALVTTRNPRLYCEEAPVTLVNVDQARVEAAREQQSRNGCPLFVTLAKEGLILRDPALQLVHHYGQKLFAQLWAVPRVRFVFEQQELPDYTRDLSSADENVDQWSLSTLRFVQYTELSKREPVDATCVPAYTRDGYERVQQLRLTDAEAQFASQFNGARSIAQIAKNLRLDIKFARLSLFRFLALEIVECWPAQVMQKKQSRGLRGIFSR